MGAASSGRTLLLHALRVVGVSDSARLGAVTGLPAEEVDAEVARLLAEDAVREQPGLRGGYQIIDKGQDLLTAQLAVELDVPEVRSTVEESYARFTELNPQLLSICNDWQLRRVDGELQPNDHSDQAYDQVLIERLAALDASVQPVCAALTGALTRFGRYGPGFTAALGCLRSGDTDWLTKPMLPSYHTVWFELHEDLLVTLDRDRASERT